MKSETPELDKAVYNFQQEVDIIAKKETAKIEGKGANYTYKFAGMPAIWETIKPLLKKHGLLVKQPVVTWDGQMAGDYLKMTVTHIPSGEYETEYMRLVVRRDDPQAFGAGATFAKRYQLGNYFGLITEDDDDAAKSRLATAEQKKEWVTAFTVVSKKINPEAQPTYNDFAKFLNEVYKKGINEIKATESQAVLDTIKAFDGE